jgi:hypothetical protein
MDFEIFMTSVWRLGAKDRPSAIELLKSAGAHDLFYPWGAFALMTYSFREGRELEARVLANEIGRRAPHFFQAWWLQVCLSRGMPEYSAVCGRIIDAGYGMTKAFTKEAMAPLLESALTARSAKAKNVRLVKRIYGRRWAPAVCQVRGTGRFP